MSAIFSEYNLVTKIKSIFTANINIMPDMAFLKIDLEKSDFNSNILYIQL